VLKSLADVSLRDKLLKRKLVFVTFLLLWQGAGLDDDHLLVEHLFKELHGILLKVGVVGLLVLHVVCVLAHGVEDSTFVLSEQSSVLVTQGFTRL